MSTKTLIDKIESLPPEKRAEVEHFVESLARGVGSGSVKTPALSPDLLGQIHSEREALLREHGPIETQEIIRDLRESGGR